MIRINFILIICLTLGTQMVKAQAWRDSLSAARNLYNKHEYGRAFKSYQNTQKLAPEEIDLSEEMAQSAYKSQQYKKAEEIYQAQGAKETDQKKKARDFHNLGNTRMKSKDYQGAADAYKESLRNNPNDNDTRYNLSEAIRQMKDQQQKKNKNQEDQDGKQNQQNQQNEQNNSNEKSQSNEANKPQDGKSSEGQGKANTGPKLKDKAVEKKLDDLMKQEADTKRRLSGNASEKGSSKSGKDW